MFEKFKEYMNSNAVAITKTGEDGEKVFEFTLSNWSAWGIAILLGILVIV